MGHLEVTMQTGPDSRFPSGFSGKVEEFLRAAGGRPVSRAFAPEDIDPPEATAPEKSSIREGLFWRTTS
jgi:hypothetical protein